MGEVTFGNVGGISKVLNQRRRQEHKGEGNNSNAADPKAFAGGRK